MNTRARRQAPNNGGISDPSPVHVHGDLLEELFLESLNKSSERHVPKATLKPNTASLELYPHVEKLLEMLNDPDTPIQDMWALVTTEICPRVLPKDTPTPYSLHFASKSLFRKLLAARQQSPVASGVPTVSEISRTYARMSLLQPRVWNPMLETFFTKERVEKLQSDGPVIAEDLLESWRAILAHPTYAGKQHAECINTDSRPEWVLPMLNPVRVRRAMETNGIERAFASLLPKFPHNPLHGMTASALITFAILTAPRLYPGIPYVQNHPFTKGIADVIVMAQITPGALGDYFRTLKLSYFDDLNIKWSNVIEQARNIAGLSATIVPEKKSVLEKSFHRSTTNQETRIARQLSRALTAKNLESVERLWDEVLLWSTKRHDERDLSTFPGHLGKPSTPSRELGNQFIIAFMALHKQRAVEVWNCLIQWGLPPTVTTWHAMLQGCKASRDSHSLLAIWSKLIGSGMVPDVECWTTFISGLMYSGDLESGVRAFVEMKTTWEEAARKQKAQTKSLVQLQDLGDVGEVVKPTTAVVNAVIVGLLRKNRTDIASHILTIGGNMGIRPDTITYNTILRSLVRNKDDEALTNLLKQMQDQGIQGDVATFTTILESALADSKNRSPDELIEVVNNLFTEMEASGVKANQQTFAAIINGILRRAPNTDYMTIANFVIARMQKMGLEPSPHIHTMLIDFHFKQDRPNLDAIGLLLDKLIKTNALRDHILWDRVIEGYCYVGDTVRALHYLRQSKKDKFRVGYVALDMLIHALSRNNEMDLAIELVRNTKAERGGPPAPDARGVDGQHRFWESAKEMGLVEEATERM